MTIQIINSHPESAEAKELINELSEILIELTGDNGKSSFSDKEFDSPRSSFIVIQNNGENVACGSIRPISNDVCEIKRMYSKKPGHGFGGQVLKELENRAKEFGFKEIWISTRIINKKAVDFYKANKYSLCESYGKYKNQPESICLSKDLSTTK